MTKDLDQKVAHAMGLKSVNNCEQWGVSMTKDEIMEMARQAGFFVMANSPDLFQRLEAFAKLVAKHTPSNIDPSMKPYGYVRKDGEGLFIYGEHQFQNQQEHELVPVYLKEALAQTERPADCERCNRLEEQAYDLVGKLRVANIKLSMQPQRKPLTENAIKHLWYEACQTNLELTSQLIVHLARNIEAAHGIKE